MSDFKEERYVKRRVIVFLILLGLLLWVIRVVNLNREKESDVMYMELGQKFYYGELAIQADDLNRMLRNHAEAEGLLYLCVSAGYGSIP